MKVILNNKYNLDNSDSNNEETKTDKNTKVLSKFKLNKGNKALKKKESLEAIDNNPTVNNSFTGIVKLKSLDSHILETNYNCDSEYDEDIIIKRSSDKGLLNTTKQLPSTFLKKSSGVLKSTCSTKSVSKG